MLPNRQTDGQSITNTMKKPIDKYHKVPYKFAISKQIYVYNFNTKFECTFT